MVNLRRILVVGIVIAASGSLPNAAAAADCPLHSGSETVWQIDSLAADTALSACTAASSDCSLVGAIKKLNVDLKTLCTPAELTEATLRISFNAAPAAGLTLAVTDTLQFSPPSTLGKLVIDGMRNDRHFAVRTAPFELTAQLQPQPVLAIKCTPPAGQSDCAHVEHFPDLEVRNLDFSSSWIGLRIESGTFTTGGGIHLHDLVLDDIVHQGVSINGWIAAAAGLTVDHATVRLRPSMQAYAALGIVGSTFSSANFTSLQLNRSAQAGQFGIQWFGGRIANLVLHKSQIAGTRALYLESAAPPEGVEPGFISVQQSDVVFMLAGLDVRGPLQQLQIADSAFTGQQHGTAISLLNGFAAPALQNVALQNVTLEDADIGLAVKGNVRDVAVTNTRFDTIAQNAIKASIIDNIPAPTNIHHQNSRFVNTNNPVLYMTNQLEWYANAALDSANPLVTQSGIDTPGELQLVRDLQDQSWIEVTVPYVDKVSDSARYVVQLYVKEGNTLLPLAIDKWSEGDAIQGKWNLRATSRIDAKHCPGYTGTALNQLSVIAMMEYYTESRQLLLTSMLSPAQSLTNTAWKGETKHVVVDTPADDLAAMGCTDAVADCSLRGAMMQIAQLRAQGHQYQMAIDFVPGLPRIELGHTLTIGNEHIGITGAEDGSTIIQAASSFPVGTPLLKIVANHVRLAAVDLGGRQRASSLVDYADLQKFPKLDDITLDHVTFFGIGPDQSAITAPLSIADQSSWGYARLIDPVFDHLDAAAHVVINLRFPFDANSGAPMQLAHIERMRVIGTALPTQLMLGKTPAVKIIGESSFDLREHRASVEGQFDNPELIGSVQAIDAYVSFSHRPDDIRLEYAGSYTPSISKADGGFQLTVELPQYTSEQLISFGTMSLSLIAQIQGDGLYGSTILSAPVAIFDPATADSDNDGIKDVLDNAPLKANFDQLDTDHDGVGNVADYDDDADGVLDVIDNCSTVKNPDQTNSDTDTSGNACDADDDADGIADEIDTCALTANADQQPLVGDLSCTGDQDHDGVPDTVDNSPAVANPDQTDSDGDGIGDVSDPDIDNDGVPNAADPDPTIATTGPTGGESTDSTATTAPAGADTVNLTGSGLGTGTAPKEEIISTIGVSSEPAPPPPEAGNPASGEQSGGGCSLLLSDAAR